MTWQIEHTITWDPTGDAGTQALAAMKYLTDTFLPAKGWTSGPRPGDDLTSNVRIIQRNFTDLWTNTAAKHYLWLSLSTNTTWEQREDATYTTTPGDLGTDNSTFRNLQTSWHSTSETWGQKNVKFWGSTENNKSFMVTRWDRIICWDPGINWPVVQPNTTIAATEGPSVDRYSTALFIPAGSRFKGCNLPDPDNDNQYPWDLYFGFDMNASVKGGDGGLWDKVPFAFRSDNGPRAIWDQADVKYYSYGNGSSTFTDAFMPVRVNNGNYWLFTKGSLVQSQMVFDLGPTLPDFN